MDIKLEYEKQGYYFAKGFFNYLGILAGIILILSIIISLMKPVDNSDIDRIHRSGLKIYTDNLTGLQYFSTANGGLYPRLDVKGKQMIKNK